MYVHYGCGLDAPEKWKNYDVSPTLRLQKIPIVGKLIRSSLNTTFPSNVKYGNIILGLPVKDNSCDGVYCSHTLEHLALEDFRVALKNTYKILKPGGIFRCVVPDLEVSAREYVRDLDENRIDSNHAFMYDTRLGHKKRKRGLKGLLTAYLGNAKHLYMWDHLSMKKELEDVGFVDVRICKYNDSSDKMFHTVENPDRFKKAVAYEVRK